MSSILISPSILSADFAKLAEATALMEQAGADWLHVDVMDGHFVPNITIGPVVVKSLKKYTQLPLDVHLMISDPLKYAEAFAKAGAWGCTFHFEAVTYPDFAISEFRKLNLQPGMSIKPRTPANLAFPYLKFLNHILIMTVEPGFGGQSFMADMLPKIEEISKYIKDHKLDCKIEVDGGINTETGKQAVEAGANVLVAGNAVFNAPDPIQAVKDLKISKLSHHNLYGFLSSQNFCPRVCLTLIFTLGSITSLVQAEKTEFLVTDVQGQSAVIPQGAKKASPIEKNLPVHTGDRIVTGNDGEVELSTKRGTVIKLKPNTNLEVQSFSDRLRRFFLRSGRFLGSFKKNRKKRNRIRTPVSVASVRGTELALVVDEEQELQAGVVEGEVAFGPLDEEERTESDLESIQKTTTTIEEQWEEEVIVKGSEGIVVKANQKPTVLNQMPPLVVAELNWFDHVKDRVKKIKVQHRNLKAKYIDKIRETSLKETIDWEIPENFLETLERPTPEKPSPEKFDIPNPK